MIRWFTSSINKFRFAEFINPTIAPRPKAVGDTLVQSRLGGRDVAPIEADLPVRQVCPVGLLPAIGPRPSAFGPVGLLQRAGGRDVAPIRADLPVRQVYPVGLHKIAMVIMLIGCGFMTSSIEAAVVAEREPMTLRVVAVNPSSEKNRTIPIRIDLPQEVKPTDILEQGDLEVEFDTDKSLYYVHKPEVTLAPKQMRVFEVIVRDVWFIPSEEILGLRTQTELILKRLEQSEYADSAKSLGGSILNRLSNIEQIQVDETISRKQRIGAYRRNLLMLEQIKDDLTRLEKLLSFTGGPPIPEMLEESPLKSDAPSTTTTWLVIFLIVIFMGLLAGQFFFTWHRRIKHTTFSEGRSSQFPQSQSQDRGLGERPEVAP